MRGCQHEIVRGMAEECFSGEIMEPSFENSNEKATDDDTDDPKTHDDVLEGPTRTEHHLVLGGDAPRLANDAGFVGGTASWTMMLRHGGCFRVGVYFYMFCFRRRNRGGGGTWRWRERGELGGSFLRDSLPHKKKKEWACRNLQHPRLALIRRPPERRADGLKSQRIS